MKREAVRKRIGIVTLAVVVAGLAAGAIAYATIPNANVIQGCYDSGGNVKVVQALPCPKGYTALAWNQIGPAGPAGAAGPSGPGRPYRRNGAGGTEGRSWRVDDRRSQGLVLSVRRLRVAPHRQRRSELRRGHHDLPAGSPRQRQGHRRDVRRRHRSTQPTRQKGVPSATSPTTPSHWSSRRATTSTCYSTTGSRLTTRALVTARSTTQFLGRGAAPITRGRAPTSMWKTAIFRSRSPSARRALLIRGGAYVHSGPACRQG